MKSKNGKVMRESSTASSIFPASPANPGARKGTIHGMNISNNKTKMLKKKAKTEIARAANKRADSLSSDTSLWDSIGTKAVVKAPSAKRERKRFGNLKETKKASEIIEEYAESSVYISDYLSVLRRITEHSQNIAESLI